MSGVDHEAAVAKLLADLGDTPDAVADRLRALDIKGRQHRACQCVLAQYINSNIPGKDYAWVHLGKRAVISFGDSTRIPLPPPVAEFARRFDRGVYLDLIEVP